MVSNRGSGAGPARRAHLVPPDRDLADGADNLQIRLDAAPTPALARHAHSHRRSGVMGAARPLAIGCARSVRGRRRPGRPSADRLVARPRRPRYLVAAPPWTLGN